jgi:hypothetical protein
VFYKLAEALGASEIASHYLAFLVAVALVPR